MFTGTTVSVTGNITGGNILGGANVNATLFTGTTVSVTGNITGGNINTAGVVSASGNITGGNVNVTGMSLTGNVVSNLNVTGAIVGNTITATSLFTLPTVSVDPSTSLTPGTMIYNQTAGFVKILIGGQWRRVNTTFP